MLYYITYSKSYLTLSFMTLFKKLAFSRHFSPMCDPLISRNTFIFNYWRRFFKKESEREFASPFTALAIILAPSSVVKKLL